MLGFLLSVVAAIDPQPTPHAYKGLFKIRPAQPAMGDEIIVTDSFFLDCRAQVDGGALSHFSPDAGTLSVTRTTFIRCRSGRNPGDGGCIYFSGAASEISSSCVSHCCAGRDGHSFCISIRGGRPSHNFLNVTAAVNCGKRDVPIGWQTLYLGFGQIRISDYNCSKNTVDFQAAAFMMHTMDSDAVATFATVEANRGPWIVYFFGQAGSRIAKCNVIGNVLAGEAPRGVFYYHKYGVVED
jgi:hypothetical protein